MSDPEIERETTVIHTREGGSGVLIAVILLIAVLALLFYLFGGQLLGTTDKADIQVDVDTPVEPAKSGS